MKRIAWNPLIDGLLESVWLVDPVDLCILTVNQAACDLIGLSKEMMVGKPVVELTATPEDQFFWEDVAAGLLDSIHSETLLRGADGLAVAVERRVSKVWAEADRAVYLVGIHDLRHQRRAENELERLVAELRATLESTADGILVSDLEGNIRNYNRHFSQLWNVPEALLLTRNDQALYAHLVQQVCDEQHYQRSPARDRQQPAAGSQRHSGAQVRARAGARDPTAIQPWTTHGSGVFFSRHYSESAS